MIAPLLDFEIIKCIKCGNDRKALKETPRAKHKICGNCWNWQASEEENLKLIGKPNN